VPSKTLRQIAEHLGAELFGDPELAFSSVSALEDAGPGQLSFLSNLKYKKHLETTAASAVIVGDGLPFEKLPLLRVKDPQFAFQQAVLFLHGPRKHPHSGVHPAANVDPTAEIDESTILYPGVYIGPEVKIGRDCVLHPNVVIYDRCVIGDRVIIHSGAVIGADGFGYATHQGTHYKIPQIGIVKIEDDVEIGANSTIDRAALGVTLIGKGTKIDNLVMVAHNVQTGPHCLLVAQAGIAGSTTLGHHVVLGGQVGVAGHVEIGDGAMAGAQCGITNSVEPGQIVLGSPHVPLKDARRMFILWRELPDMVKRIKKLEAQLEKLQPGSSEEGAS
jgi:UDP-3-O-[3-hydroxymyristoyl] glucosamine N-acyltransferase